MILGACSQTATFEEADLMNEQAVEKAGFKLNPFGANGFENARAYDEADCSIDCIEPGSEDYFIKTATLTGSSGPNTKEVTYRAYNTETDFVVEVDYKKLSGNSSAASDITITIEGDVLLFEDVTFGSTVSHNIPLPDGWMACDEVDFSVLQEGLGNPIEWNETYSLFEVCSNCDDESFSYEATVAGDDLVNIIFSYDAAEALQNAEVKFTFPQIKNLPLNEDGKYEAPDEKEYSLNNSGNQTVLTWTGNIGCTNLTATTFEFEVMADCNASGKAQIWTSASVNGEEIKNENTPNIRFWCATNTIEKTNDD